jgi:hypothetical protein
VATAYFTKWNHLADEYNQWGESNYKGDKDGKAFVFTAFGSFLDYLFSKRKVQTTKHG